MTIERTKYLHEIVVQFGPDGMRAGYVRDWENVVDNETGETLVSGPSQPRKVSKEEIGEFIGTAAAEMLEKMDAREAAFVKNLNAAREEGEAARAELVEMRDKLASVAASVMAAI
jgi:hypothetical protein